MNQRTLRTLRALGTLRTLGALLGGASHSRSGVDLVEGGHGWSQLRGLAFAVAVEIDSLPSGVQASEDVSVGVVADNQRLGRGESGFRFGMVEQANVRFVHTDFVAQDNTVDQVGYV